MNYSFLGPQCTIRTVIVSLVCLVQIQCGKWIKLPEYTSINASRRVQEFLLRPICSFVKHNLMM